MAERFVALLGTGAWGRNHARVLVEAGVLARAFDPDAEALARSVPEDLRASSLDALLADPMVRAVVIATPARTHHELALRALEAGHDVLVEKPLTLDLSQGEELVRLASLRERVLMVGHVTLYHPGIEALKRQVDAGAVGAVRYLYSNRLNLGTVREEEDILWSFAPHDVAVLLHLLGRMPERVRACGGSYLRSDRADVTVTHLDFPRGVRAHIFVSWLHPFKEHRLVVIGESGMLVFTDGAGGGELVFYDHPLDSMEGPLPPPRDEGREVAFDRSEPLRAEVDHFLRCIAERSVPRSGGRHGLSVLRVLDAARTSLAEEGAPVECVEMEQGLP